MATGHGAADTAETVPHSDFDNALASNVKRGDEIIERDAKGRVSKRYPVTEVIVSPAGCKMGVHVTVRGGSAWCYDMNARVEIG